MALKARTLLYAASPLHNPTGTTQKWIVAYGMKANGLNISVPNSG